MTHRVQAVSIHADVCTLSIEAHAGNEAIASVEQDATLQRRFVRHEDRRQEGAKRRRPHHRRIRRGRSGDVSTGFFSFKAVTLVTRLLLGVRPVS